MYISLGLRRNGHTAQEAAIGGGTEEGLQGGEGRVKDKLVV